MARALIGGLVAKGDRRAPIAVVEISAAARERLAARYPVHVERCAGRARAARRTRRARGEAARHARARSHRLPVRTASS